MVNSTWINYVSSKAIKLQKLKLGLQTSKFEIVNSVKKLMETVIVLYLCMSRTMVDGGGNDVQHFD